MHSFSELDISNPTLLAISKQILLNKIDEKAVNADGQPLITTEKPRLAPIDCAMFMNAFAKEGFFGDPALQESLMACFMERITEADGADTVTILIAHATWFQHMVKEVLVERKQPKRVYRFFVKYSD